MRMLHFLIRPGVIWLLILTGASLYAAYGELRSRRRDEELMVTVRRLDEIVGVFIATLGDPVEVVKARLTEALRR